MEADNQTLSTMELTDRFYLVRSQRDNLRRIVNEALGDLANIVCTDDVDGGVVLLSNDSPTHYDSERNCQVYNHEHFSPLGDALVALHKKLKLGIESCQ